MRAERKPEQWTAGFIVQIHREIFGEYFPEQAGNFRPGEAHFGKRAGVLRDRLDSVFQQIVLETADEVRKVRRADLPDAFLVAAHLHAKMIDAHPFIDGNGRWARAVTNAFVRDAGYESGTVILKQDKKLYIAAIDRALDNGECGDLAAILIQGYIAQSEVRTKITHRYR